MPAHTPPGPSHPATAEAGPAGRHRRTVLRGTAALGLLGLAGALSACGGSENTAPATAAQDDTSPAAGSSGTGPASDPAPAGGAQAATDAAAARGTVLGATADIPVGGGKIFKDAAVVVTQPKKGTFKAFTAICTHTGCPVAEVAEGTINCFCHGSQYSIQDGSVVTPPAPKPLAAKDITVAAGKITLT